MSIIYIAIGLLFLLTLVAIIWKISSRSLPCPVGFSWLVELDNPLARAHHAKVIVEHLNLNTPGMKVLDAGCGPGRLTIPIATKIAPNGVVTALDVQTGMLDRVREKANKANLSNIHYLQAKLGEGKLKQNEYDRAILIAVLGEIPDQKSALREIFDSLKPGGFLLVTETIFDPHFQRKANVLQLAKEAGFQFKETDGNLFAYTMKLEKP